MTVTTIRSRSLVLMTAGVAAASVVVVFKVVGKGDTSLVFALTRGDTSAKAVKSATHRVHSA